MRVQRTIVIVLVLTALILVAVSVFGACSASASEATPDPDPTAAPLPEATPAPIGWVKWARKWQRLAHRAHKTWNRARRCLGMKARRFEPRYVPPRIADKQTWKAAGKAWKQARADYRARTSRLLQRMSNPGGSGAARWKPLARWVGWPTSSLSRLTYIIHRESRGNPRAKNPVSTASGLLQFLSSWWRGRFDPFDPKQSLRCGLNAWRQVGWQPWAL